MKTSAYLVCVFKWFDTCSFKQQYLIQIHLDHLQGQLMQSMSYSDGILHYQRILFIDNAMNDDHNYAVALKFDNDDENDDNDYNDGILFNGNDNSFHT